MNRSIAALIFGSLLLGLAVVLLVWLQADWSATQEVAFTPLLALGDWRGLVGYAAGTASIPVIFMAVYGIKRHRRSGNDVAIEDALAQADGLVGFRK